MPDIALIEVGFRGPPGRDGDGATWASLPGKPLTFPPEAHSHAISEITGLTQALADAGAAPIWGAVTGKPAVFPPSAHQHPWSDLTGIPATFAPAAHTHAWADITGKPSIYAPAARVHAVADVAGLQAALDGKSATGHTHAWTEITGRPATFAPSAHTHPWSDLVENMREDHNDDVRQIANQPDRIENRQRLSDEIRHFTDRTIPPR